jgi:hypothetical protein
MSAPSSTTAAVIPAPRSPADARAARRPQHPADQYWNVFEACWCVAKECLKAVADPR